MSRLIKELESLGLNAPKADPLDEADRIRAKQLYCRQYALVHQGDPNALWDVIERTASTCESSARYIEIGARVRGGGRKGHRIAYGDRASVWAEWQLHIDALRQEYPDYSHNKLCSIAVIELLVPGETVRKHTV
ncbi:MAG: hypothetical protein ACREXR_12645 [Gammaproteobacteria bacterium]